MMAGQLRRAVARVSRPLRRWVGAVLSVGGVGCAAAVGGVVYLVLMTPTEFAVLLVGSAVAMALACYAPLFAVLAVAWLVE